MNGAGHASRTFFVVLTFFVVIAALRLAQDVFIPLALAVLMTFLLAPLVERLQRWGINRAVAVIVTVLVAFLVLGGVLYIVFSQLRDLAKELPQYREQLFHNVTQLSGALKGSMGRIAKLTAELGADLRRVTPGEPGRPIPKVEVVEPLSGLQAIRQLISPLAGPLATAAVVIVFVIFMLLRFSDLRERMIRMLGASNLRLATEAIDDAARRVSRYLLMQTLINSWEGFCVAVGLTLIGLPNAILWGALTTVLRFIPYVGILIAATMPLALSFAVFDHWLPPLLIVAVYAGVETLSYVVLEPWLYSRRTGVSPVALLVAAVFWAWLWGAAGLFLAIPLTVCLVVMGKYIPQLAFLNILLGDEPALAPHERLYQRLLANSQEDADDLVEEELRRMPLAEVCDKVLLPAMYVIERDHDQGSLRDAKRKYMLDHLERWTEELTESMPEAVQAAVANPIGGPGAGSAASGLAVGERTGILCLAAADRADEIAARLTGLVFSERGYSVRTASRPGMPDTPLDAPPAVVIISAMPGDAPAHARHLCRRVRVRFAEVPIIVGLWQSVSDIERSWQRLASAGATRVETSLSAALEEMERLATEGAARLPPPPPAVHPSRTPTTVPRMHA
ncbi:MAG TPA: AI-2E family transporter [Steroidobacteraceae bacterium]|nr:AI-2E family transporter [Steroidobacteraceae bacterium]